MTISSNTSSFYPVKKNLISIYFLSLFVVFLMIVASLAGFFFPNYVFPTPELKQSYLANDAVNFIIGLPILLVSMWLSRREKLIGLLCWPGALLYTFYNYIAYVIGLPFKWQTLVYVSIVLLCGYLVFILFKSIEWASVHRRLEEKVSEKFSGVVLVFYGVMFFFLALGVVTDTNTNETTILMPDIGVAVADIILSVLLLIGGIFLFQRKTFVLFQPDYFYVVYSRKRIEESIRLLKIHNITINLAAFLESRTARFPYKKQSTILE